MTDETRHLVPEPQASTSRSYDSIEDKEPSIVLEDKTSCGRRCLYACASVLLALVLLGGIVILVVLLVVVGGQPPRVTTTCGQLEGIFDVIDSVFIYKGIPYAVPPVENRRWKSPEMLSKKEGTCWESMYKATSYKPPCIQKDFLTNRISGSEDCLYLNVFVPSVDKEKLRPVVVFFHGGEDLQTGYASLEGYTPYPQLAQRLDMVFVCVQYRLNAFGYLTLKIIESGNFGLQDQILALTWIKRNIRQFGGNPNKVTLLGQGSGATSILAMLASPKAKGLFHGAWLMSPSPILNTTLETAAENNEFFLTKTNTSTIGEIQKLKDIDVVRTVYPIWKFMERFDLPTKDEFKYAKLVVDGEILPKSPDETWKNKKTEYFSDVPVVIGTTAQEIDVNPVPGTDMKSWTSTEYTQQVGAKLNKFNSNVTNTSLQLYPFSQGSEMAYTTMASDIRVTCGVNELASTLASAMTSPVYRYIVTGKPSSPVMYYGSRYDATLAFSGFDLLALLDTLGLAMSGTKPKSSDISFGNILRTNFVSFVEKGVPVYSNWQSFPNHTALLDGQQNIVRKAYHLDQCGFIQQSGLINYSWQI